MEAGKEKKREYTILVAEDNRINKKLVETILKKEGFSVVSAADGNEVISIYNSREDLDLILMDVQMPNLDGLEATRIIRDIENEKTRPRIPIIALTSFAMKGDREKCLEAGCNSYVAKPLDKKELMEKIKEYLLVFPSIARAHTL